MGVRTMNVVGRIRNAVVGAAGGGLMLISACSIQDVGLNLVSGSLAFVEDYAQEFWGAIVPEADQLLGGDEGGAE